jgi:hypothetical protein
MSTRPTRFSLQLPGHWTPEQALAVYELLNELAESVWNRYEIPLNELLAPAPDAQDDAQLDLFDFDNAPPF